MKVMLDVAAKVYYCKNNVPIFSIKNMKNIFISVETTINKILYVFIVILSITSNF